MKKIFVYAALAMVLCFSAFARPAEKPSPRGVGSPDVECRNHGFDFGITKFEWTCRGYVQEGSALPPYVITVTGSSREAAWSSNLPVAGVIEKESTDFFTYDGGTDGTVSRLRHDISHVTFCGMNSTDGGDDPGDNPGGQDVPEFTTLGAAAVLMGAGLIISRRRK